jgi:copper transport protein
VSRTHGPRHHGLGATVASGGGITWATRADYGRKHDHRRVCGRAALVHHGTVTSAGRRAIAVLIAAFAALAIPLVVSAHSLLVSESPKPGAHLGTAPGVVVLEFTEALNAQLSSATVVDPTGHRWNGAVDSSLEIRIALATNAIGIYTVDWTSVSEIDGHKISGQSFTFDVGIGGTAPEVAANLVPGPQLSDIAIGAIKWIEALALLLLAGQVLMSRLASRPPPLDWVKPGFRASSVALSAGLVVVWAEATVGSGGHSIPDYLAFFGDLSGVWLIARLVFEALTLVAVVQGRRNIMPFTLFGALVMLAAGGHASGVDPAWFGIGLDALHLIAAGLWAGGIAALALLRPPGGWRSAEARQLIRRFTPVALGAFATTIVAGGLEAIQQLGSIQSLYETSYGRVLLVKMALIALMLPLSLMAWRWKRPHVRIEASVAACVIAAAALLASFPAPPTAAAKVAADEAAATPTAGLPAPGELTLAGPAGPVLVGLTLSPGLPGPNRATVYVLPPEGSAAAKPLLANIVVNGTYKALTACGDTCRETTVDIKAGDAVDVDVLGTQGGEAAFVIPQLPAPPGGALITKLEAAMKTLTAFQYSEFLNSGTTTEHGAESAVAPDRSTWNVAGAGQTTWIGHSEYIQATPGSAWIKQATSDANNVLSFVWDYYEPLTNAFVIGHPVINGVPTTEVEAFGNAQDSPIWFTFFVDSGGLVQKVGMTTTGHFMTDTYTSFNKPVPIDPPAG